MVALADVNPELAARLDEGGTVVKMQQDVPAPNLDQVLRDGTVEKVVDGEEGFKTS